jgi:hypothetical protein
MSIRYFAQNDYLCVIKILGYEFIKFCRTIS